MARVVVKQHVVKPLPRVPLEKFYDPEYASFRRMETPFLMPGAAAKWPAMKKWNLDWLATTMGTRRADFYPHNMWHETARPFMTSMEEAVAELRAPSGRYPKDAGHTGTYIHWNMNMHDWAAVARDMGPLPRELTADDDWLAGCLPPPLDSEFLIATHWRMLIVGDEGAGMFNHFDTLRTSSYQAQISGAKRWHLCAQNQSAYVGGAGQVNMFDPDYDAFPQMRGAACYEDVVRAGDVVFYPMEYWHQTENYGASIAVTSTLADRFSFREVARELEQECVSREKRFGHMSPELCEALRTCFRWWHDAYVGDFMVADAANATGAAATCPVQQQQTRRRAIGASSSAPGEL